jgi:hypothetical protein
MCEKVKHRVFVEKQDDEDVLFFDEVITLDEGESLVVEGDFSSSASENLEYEGVRVKMMLQRDGVVIEGWLFINGKPPEYERVVIGRGKKGDRVLDIGD